MPNKSTTAVETQVGAYLARCRMLAGVRRLGVAVSGGSDSIALLRLLIPLCRAAGVTPVALHLDHGLRGAASAADARFVAKLAKRLKIECHMGAAGSARAYEHEDEGRGRRTISGSAVKNPSLSTLHPPPNTCRRTPATQSLEMAARNARQTFFREAEEQCRLDAIATGHTADDVAETLLLRLARGSGATGLSGLRPCHAVAGVRFVRPLLGCSHEELRAWLRRKRQGWREDASNLDERIPRNRLRHTVLPWLEQNWSPSIRAMLAQSASILRDEDALLDQLVRQAMQKSFGDATVRRSDGPTVRLSDSSYSTLRIPPSTLPVALQRRVIRQWLLDAGCAEAAGWNEVETILSRLDAKTAWQVSLPGGVLARGGAGRLVLVRAGLRVTDATDETELGIPGRVNVAGVRVTARLTTGITRTRGPVGALPSACTLDAAALQGRTLLARTRRPGDRIRPLGLEGSKSIQDLFVDAKVPAERRDRLPLLVMDGEVVWVPGYRVARKYAVQGPRAASVRVEMKVIGQ